MLSIHIPIFSDRLHNLSTKITISNRQNDTKMGKQCDQLNAGKQRAANLNNGITCMPHCLRSLQRI